jgi:hypothetical protein
MVFLCFLWPMMVSIQERLQELRDPLAKNLCIARRCEDGWLQNRANFLDDAIGSLGPTAHGLDDAFDIVALLVGARGQFVDVVQHPATVLEQRRNLGFEFRQRLRHACGVLAQLQDCRYAERDENHDSDGCEK